MLIAATPALATVHVIHVQMDANLVGAPSYYGDNPWAFPEILTVAEGDTVDLTYSFLNGARIRLDGPDVVRTSIGQDATTYAGGTLATVGTLATIDVTSVVTLVDSGLTPFNLSRTSCCTMIGSGLLASDFIGGTGAGVTFSAIRSVITVGSHTKLNPGIGGPVTSRQYQKASLYIDNGFTVLPGVSSPVPDPATWLMMVAGFGIVGATTRRRRTLATI